ncbi:hypothetical protein NL676_005971 [Syzygium grande]|nr:hypothetical protein NL676_005971 [Syzygium grande]
MHLSPKISVFELSTSHQNSGATLQRRSNSHLVHFQKQVPGNHRPTDVKITRDQGVPSDRTPLTQLVEQVMGVRDSASFTVHIDESTAQIDVRSEPHFDDDGKQDLSLPSTRGVRKNACRSEMLPQSSYSDGVPSKRSG